MTLIDRLRSEFAYLSGSVRILRKVTPIARNRSHTFADLFDGLAERHADRAALIGEDRSFTYRELWGRASQYARWARETGVGKGDIVALFMPNRAEYLAVWMGIIQTGGVVALVNTNLTGKPLAHCLNIAGARHVIVAAGLLPALDDVLDDLESRPNVWVSGGAGSAHPDIGALLDGLPDAPLAANERAGLTIDDPALYIYTSGTTGLPKAAVINHYRVQAGMAAYAALTRAGAGDRIYSTLPMYHTTGGVLAPGIALMTGGACVIRERFSASRFWDDIVANDCTMFQYIGELCRYLLNAPCSEAETRHRVRLCNGNGLRPDIWMDFKARFRIPEIVEWYAATEGNVLLFNMDGKPGAIGRIPWWLRRKFQTKLISVDLDTEAPLRGRDGFCVECAPGEVGEAVGRIVIDPLAPGQRFDGYADAGESERKVLQDVFETGDRWFRTGDLMKTDDLGYFYFVDRIGDTFRWKSENVSTSEVAETVATFPGVRDATVYGVEVSGHEGRAGMAAIVGGDDLDLEGLRAYLDERLPVYARPLFLRLRDEIEMTGTFKQRKVELRREGFNPDPVRDDIYFNDLDGGRLRKLDAGLYAQIIGGGIRL